MALPLSMLLCLVAGVIGAYFSLKSSQGGSALLAFGAGLVAIGVWAWMTKQPIKPWVAAVVFDGVYGLSWLMTLLVLGERPTGMQMYGAIMVLMGLMMASIEG